MNTKQQIASERLKNLVDGLIRDAEMDAPVDDVEVHEDVLAYARRETWGRPWRQS